MTYQATWANGTSGRVTAAVDYIRLSDVQEIADCVNRRRQLLYQSAQDYSSVIKTGALVGRSVLSLAMAPPFDNFRSAVTGPILNPACGTLGGQPASPESMVWLWPIAGANENNTIVTGFAGVGSGQVGLFTELNGGANWTDPSLATLGGYARAIHINELRQTMEWLSRGRWRMPIYFDAGLMSLMPTTPWIGNMIGNNGTGQLQDVGQVLLRPPGMPAGQLGLTGVQVRVSSSIQITADTTCTIQLYRCIRAVCFASSNLPTWNQYDPAGGHNWSAPGGTGAGDAVLIGTYPVTANQTAVISDANVQAAIQAIVNGAEQNLLIRRSDVGFETIGFSAELVVEFDLQNPPN
jgi:hypothetical protein